MDETLKKLTDQLLQQISISNFRNDSGNLLITDLVGMIAAGNYRDELDHSLTMFKAYEDLRSYLEKLK